MDPRGREEIFSEIQTLHRENTIALVSHSMEDVARLADRIIVMNKGQVALTGTPKEVFARADELKQMGLDVPQITSLMTRLRERGMDVPTDIYTLEQAKDVLRKVLEGRRHA